MKPQPDTKREEAEKEQARQDLLVKLEDTVAVNPDYAGKTVKEAVREVLGVRLRVRRGFGK